MINDQELLQIEERLSATSKTVWHLEGSIGSSADLRFIINARNDVRKLIDEVKRLKDRLRECREILSFYQRMGK